MCIYKKKIIVVLCFFYNKTSSTLYSYLFFFFFIQIRLFDKLKIKIENITIFLSIRRDKRFVRFTFF